MTNAPLAKVLGVASRQAGNATVETGRDPVDVEPVVAGPGAATTVVGKGGPKRAVVAGVVDPEGNASDVVAPADGTVVNGTVVNGTVVNGIVVGKGTVVNGIVVAKGTVVNGIVVGKGTVVNGTVEGKGTVVNGTVVNETAAVDPIVVVATVGGPIGIVEDGSGGPSGARLTDSGREPGSALPGTVLSTVVVAIEGWPESPPPGNGGPRRRLVFGVTDLEGRDQSWVVGTIVVTALRVEDTRVIPAISTEDGALSVRSDSSDTRSAATNAATREAGTPTAIATRNSRARRRSLTLPAYVPPTSGPGIGVRFGMGSGSRTPDRFRKPTAQGQGIFLSDTTKYRRTTRLTPMYAVTRACPPLRSFNPAPFRCSSPERSGPCGR